NSFALPGTDSQAAVDLLHERFPEASGDVDTVVLSTRGTPVTEPTVRLRAEALLDEIAAIGSVQSVRSPYGPGGATQVSTDGTVAYATVQYRTGGIEVPRADLEALTDVVERAGGDELEV